MIIPIILGFFSVLPVMAWLHWLTWRRLIAPTMLLELPVMAWPHWLYWLIWRRSIAPAMLLDSWARAIACVIWCLSLIAGYITTSAFWLGEIADEWLSFGSIYNSQERAQIAFFAQFYPYWQIVSLAYLVSRVIMRSRCAQRTPGRWRWLRHSGWALPLIGALSYGGPVMISSQLAASAQERQKLMLRMAFICTHEEDALPILDPQADQLFKYARYLEKKEDPKDINDIARYYRIAAAYGHYKANHNLQLLVSQGVAASAHPATETIDLATQLIAQGVPGGYYDMGHYLELGYGVKHDSDMARRYFRKAADLGNPEAQAYIGDLLAPSDRAPWIALQMRQCATDQGYGDAANTLGIHLQNRGRYPEATQAFQKGVAAGDGISTSVLEGAFKGPQSSTDLDYLALSNDPERSRRYKLIGKFIDANDGRNPKVPDIDQIVPLPPANLPEWDGTFQWQKEQDTTPPPAKPADDLIERMSKAKNLDPATGLPIPPPA